ncbi:uncharacterized protein LOC115215857 [Argonauta hians]
MFPDMFDTNIGGIDSDDVTVSNKCSREHLSDLSTTCLYRRRSSGMSQTTTQVHENKSSVSLVGLLILSVCFMYAAFIFLMWTLFGKIFTALNIGVTRGKSNKFQPSQPSIRNNRLNLHPVSSGR